MSGGFWDWKAMFVSIHVALLEMWSWGMEEVVANGTELLEHGRIKHQ